VKLATPGQPACAAEAELVPLSGSLRSGGGRCRSSSGGRGLCWRAPREPAGDLSCMDGLEIEIHSPNIGTITPKFPFQLPEILIQGRMIRLILSVLAPMIKFLVSLERKSKTNKKKKFFSAHFQR